jgi:hypothetical protein
MKWTLKLLAEVVPGRQRPEPNFEIVVGKTFRREFRTLPQHRTRGSANRLRL